MILGSAGTTDAIFLEKPQYYDLIIDLTTSTAAKATRPTLYLSRFLGNVNPRGPTHRLSAVRFTWSDVKLWTELDRLLQLDANEASQHGPHNCGAAAARGASAWSDAWRLYEDVCIVCAGLWIGNWRGNSTGSYSSSGGNWGSVRLEGDDDLSAGGSFVRSLGSGIEGRPIPGAFRDTLPTSKAMRRSSGMSMWSLGGRSSRAEGSNAASSSSVTPGPEPMTKDAEAAARGRQVLTTLALLQVLHANTGFLLARLAVFLPSSTGGDAGPMILTPKDVMSFELGPLSGLDAKFIEWLADEYGGGVRLVVRKGWKDLVGLVFGFGGS